jgi:hypothetical protein
MLLGVVRGEKWAVALAILGVWVAVVRLQE